MWATRQSAAECSFGGVQFPPMTTKRGFWRSDPANSGEVENAAAPGAETKRPRRWMKVMLTCTLSGTLGGFLISYVFPAKYVSQSTVLVEGQKVPDTYVQPVITSDFTQRIQTLSQEALAPSRLRPIVHSLAVVKPDKQRKLIETIQNNLMIEPVITSMSAAAAQADASAVKKESSAASESPVPGFNVSYVDSDPVRAQKICNAMTSLIVDENLRSRAEVAQGTVEFLQRQVEKAKSHLVDLDSKLLAIGKNRSSRSPEAEAPYKVLALEYEAAELFYKERLVKQNSAELGLDMESQQMGEQMHILASAGLPEAPDFPNRPLLALWGLGAGILLGIARLLGPITRRLFQGVPSIAAIGAEVE
jgi:uncharacterized protein involved in exopolysaccharide biosynthesis